MAETYECFKVTVADFVALVALARPPVNAQNRRFREEITAIFDTLSDRTDVRAVVLTGDGKTFSAGADLKERPGLSEEIGAYPRHNRIVRESFNAIMECEKPVIAAINGAAIGAGCVLALCCDILIASENAYLAMTEVDVGLAGGVSHVRRFFRRVRCEAPDLHGAPHDRPGALPDGRRLRLRAARRAPGNRTRHRAGNCRQEPARGPGGETVVQHHGKHAVARWLPVRAIPDRGARVQRGDQGSTARVRGEAKAVIQELVL